MPSKSHASGQAEDDGQDHDHKTQPERPAKSAPNIDYAHTVKQ